MSRAENSRRYRERHGEEIRVRDRLCRQARHDRVLAARLKYEASHPERVESHRRDVKASIARHPERQQARRRVGRAIAEGDLTRQPCESCGAEPAHAHHHLGYAPEHWLDVQWLCQKHHTEAHR